MIMDKGTPVNEIPSGVVRRAILGIPMGLYGLIEATAKASGCD
jgi:hypothetical protein